MVQQPHKLRPVISGGVSVGERLPLVNEDVGYAIELHHPIATRYDKTARNFLAAIQFAATTICLNRRQALYQPPLPLTGGLMAVRYVSFGAEKI